MKPNETTALGTTRRFTSDLRASRGELGVAELRDFARAHPAMVARWFEDECAAGRFRGPSGRTRLPDLRALLQATRDVLVPVVAEVAGEQRTVTTGLFPLIVGTLASEIMTEGYASVPSIVPELVEEIDSNKKVKHVAMVSHHLAGDVETPEGQPFPLVSASERFHTIGHLRKGFRFAVTAELLEEADAGGDLTAMLFSGAEAMAELHEEQGLQRVSDYHGSRATPVEPGVFHPGGALTALYTITAGAQTPSGTQINNNALVDESDLEAARINLASRLNTRGKRIAIPISEQVLLVPNALSGTAAKLLNSELVPGVENELNTFGPRGQFRPGRMLTSPKLDDVSTTAWYMGAFRRQFRRKWKLRLETVSVSNDPLEYLRSRVVYEARVAADVEIGAIDNVWVVRSLAAATAPGD